MNRHVNVPAPAPQERPPDPNDASCTSASKPPGWLLSECADEREIRHAWNSIRVVRTAGNGDCLFHSVRLCLLSVMSRSRAPTSAQLREAVARTVLDRRDHRATAALGVWRDVLAGAVALGDADVWRDYAHARALLSDQPPFERSSRRAVYDAMCQSDVYWGDDYALQVLERITGMALVVVGPMARTMHSAAGGAPARHTVCRGRLRAPAGTDRAARRRWFAVLCLEGAHYRPVALRIDSGRYATAFAGAAAVPRFLRAAFAAVTADAATPDAARAARSLDPFAALVRE